MQGLLNLSYCLFVLCPLRKFAIDPLACHIIVTAQLYSGSFTTCVNCNIFGSQISGCFFLDPLLFVFFLCSVDSFIFIQNESDELALLLWCLFSSLSQQSSLPCPHSLWSSYPTHFHDCAISIYASVSRGFLDLPSPFWCVGSVTISYSSTNILSSRNQSPLSLLSSQTHPMARHILSAFSQAHLHPYLPGQMTRSRVVFDPRLILLSFQTE